MMPALMALDARLRKLGFETLLQPGRHGIDLAGERVDGFPQKLIAFAPMALNLATADQALQVAKAVGADQALIVCSQADPDARRRLIATRAKWVDPAEIPLLVL